MKITLKEIRDIWQQFGFSSVFLKYLRKFTIAFVAPFLCLSIVLSFWYTSATREKLNNTALRSHAMTYDSLARFFDNMTKSYTYIKDDAYIADYFQSNTQPEQNTKAYLIQRKLSAAMAQWPELYSIYLYRYNSNYVISSVGSDYLNQFPYLNWYNHALNTQRTTFAISGDIYDYTTQYQYPSLSFCYGYYDLNTYHGLIVLNYTMDRMDELLSPNADEIFCLLNEQQSVLYSNDRSLVGTVLSDQYTYENAEKSAALKQNDSYISISQSFDNKNYSLVSITSTSANRRFPVYIVFIFCFVVLIGIILPGVLAFYLSMSFYKTVIELLRGLNGNKNDKRAIDEANFVINQVIHLADDEKNVEYELSNNIISLKNTQLAALQIQFNNHFLFNTLNMISMSARELTRSKNAVTESISLLANLLRVSLDTNHHLIPIAAEIQCAKNYIEIEHKKSNFEVIWDIDEKILDYKIIKLILQPIIENALQYGISPNSSSCKLTIRGVMTGKNIEIHIIDNGAGFSADDMKCYNELFKEKTSTNSEHIGLANVNSRIKLIFGDSYGVSIHSANAQTDVMITIPIVK